MSGALRDALDATRLDERRRAARALLRTPLLRVGHPEFVLAKRHAGSLKDWFGRETGWHLLVDAEVVRLRKAPADHGDGTRPATASGLPLRRRRYVLLCLALAALERSDAQTTLGRLAETVVAGTSDPALAAAGVRLDLDTVEDRRDLVAAVRVLLELGVLRRVAGDETGYLAGPGDALYDVDRRSLAALLVTRRGPSTVHEGDLESRLQQVAQTLAPETDDARTLALRHRLTRRLLDDPVVYLADLDDDERAYLTNQRAAIARRIEDATGLVAEIRAEGMAMVDPAGRDALTDVLIPEEGTDGHVTLLVATFLGTSPHAVLLSAVEAHVADLAATHRTVWRRDAVEPGAERGLARLALDRLVALRLAERCELAPGEPGVRARPALSRFRLGEAVPAPDAQLAMA